MSIKSEITRLVNAKTALRSRLVSKGVTVPSNALLPEMVELLDDVPGSAPVSQVTVTNSVGTEITVISPSGSKSIAAGASATVQSTVGGLIAVSMGRYYAYPQSGGTVVYTSGNIRNGQIFFIKVTAEACAVVTSTKAFM